jgi:hypothetical protein
MIPLRGKVTDYGDLLFHEEWIVKGRKHFNLIWHVGSPADTTAADRVVRGVSIPATGKRDAAMDLQADKKVTLSIEWTDEVGNPTEAPASAVATWSVDDTSIISFTDNGDSTAVAAAVGTLGTANVHVTVTDGVSTFDGDLQIVVVAGLAERINVVAGLPEEVTPDL